MLAVTVSTCLLVGMNAIALWNLLRAGRLHSEFPLKRRDPEKIAVSLLIPARNEAVNLGENLPAALSSDFGAFEILVLDDESTDVTSEVLEHFPEVRVIRGLPYPPGWTGKNWACHQLAAAASGSILIFCDADVRMGPYAVRRTVERMRGMQLDGVSAILRQRMETVSERAVLPFIMHLPVAGLLPLEWILRTPIPELSMGNGQWFAFTREAYRQIGGHRAVASEVLEDMALGRAMKRHGLRLEVVLGTEDLEVRMYRGWRELRAGFSKNLLGLLGGGRIAVLSLGVFFLTQVLPFFLIFESAVPAVALVLFRLQTAILFRTRVRDLVWHPFGVLGYLDVVRASGVARWRGSVDWKGRGVSLN